jgi:hypothetical protein
MTFRGAGYAAEHAGEYQSMQRIQGVPVGKSHQPDRIEGGRLPNSRPAFDLGNLEFLPRATGQPHFRSHAYRTDVVEEYFAKECA